MNILFLVPYPPSPVRVRPFHFLRGLAARNHCVTLATLAASQAELDDVERVRPYCRQVVALPLPRLRSMWNSLRILPTGQPLQSVYCWQPAMAGVLRDLVRSQEPPFDVAHVEHLRGARYGLLLKEIMCEQDRCFPIVWDSVDSISLLFRQAAGQSRSRLSRWITRFELPRTERYEGWLVEQFDRTLVTSPADRDELLSLRKKLSSEKGLSSARIPEGGSQGTNPPKPIQVLPNGVDLEYFTPGDETLRQPDTLVLSGKMSYHANVTMAMFLAEQIMPRIWEQRPQARLLIVGKDPPPPVRRLSQHPRITVTGAVPEIRPHLWASTLAAAPVSVGTGIQNKVLEAMATATPVVATPRAISALNVEPGRDILVAQGPDEFARAVLSLLEDPSLRRSISQAGRRYVEKYHRWESISARLEGEYLEAIQLAKTETISTGI